MWAFIKSLFSTPLLTPSIPEIVKFTAEYNGKSIDAKKGELIHIVLDSNPSTGYLWQQSATTAGVLLEVKQGVVNLTPGGPGSVEFQFRIDQSGVILLDYARPWDELNPPAKWFVLHVAVENV